MAWIMMEFNVIADEILKHHVDGSKLLENDYKQNGYLTTEEIINWLGKKMNILDVTNVLMKGRLEKIDKLS